MNYLYHRVPKYFKGKEVVPLNQLKKINPKAYNWAIGKYSEREHLFKIKIPILNCLWNDVIHMSPIHPKELEKETLNAGHNPWGSRKFFKINPKFLNQKNLAVYLYNSNKEKRILPEDFVPFKLKDLKKYKKIPKLTKDYYKKEFKAGRKPLAFPFVPHILYKGKLNVKDLEIIEI